jgi:hypothetical protein
MIKLPVYNKYTKGWDKWFGYRLSQYSGYKVVGGGTISLFLIGHRITDVRQTETQPLVPESSAYDVEMAIEMLKRHKSSSSNNSSRIH